MLITIEKKEAKTRMKCEHIFSRSNEMPHVEKSKEVLIADPLIPAIRIPVKMAMKKETNISEDATRPLFYKTMEITQHKLMLC